MSHNVTNRPKPASGAFNLFDKIMGNRQILQNIARPGRAVLGAPARPENLAQEADRADVLRTLGTHRWSLFGLSFGPRNKISEVQVMADASGMALGAFASVNGRRVCLDGDLLARIVERRFAHLEAGKPAGPPAPAAPQLILVPPRSGAQHMIVPQASQRTLSQADAEGLSPATSTTAPQSSGTITPVDAPMPGDLSRSSSATLVASPILQPTDPAALNKARFELYCTLAAAPNYFATDVEIAATAALLGRDIQVIKHGSKYGQALAIHTFAGYSRDPEAPPLMLELDADRLHFSPLVVDAAQGAALLLKVQDAQQLGPEAYAATVAAIKANTKAAKADGACFFHSIITLADVNLVGLADKSVQKLGGSAQNFRQHVVAFMRDHSDSQEFGFPGEAYDTFVNFFMPEPSKIPGVAGAYETIMASYPDLKPTTDQETLV